MITLVEFLAPVRSGAHRVKVLSTLYFAQYQEHIDALAVEDIRARLKQARVANAGKLNVADVLAKAGAYVDAPTVNATGAKEWRLTFTGEEYVREMLDLPQTVPEIENDVGSLTALARQIKEDVVRGYVEEAVLCLRVGALRAAVVFLWAAAVRRLQEDAMSAHGGSALTAAAQKHEPKARALMKLEDFSAVKDKTSLLAFREVGLLDKGQWATLQEALDLRNRCGHPTKYRPGAAKASAFVEDVVGIVFS